MKSISIERILGIAIAAVSIMPICSNSLAQTAKNEGLARQVLALRSMLDSTKTVLETRLGNVEGTINNHTRCFNSGVTSIYWPRHPSADSRGCVRHTDIVTAPPPPPPSSKNCSGGSSSWIQGSANCSGSHGPIPHGTSVTVTSSPTGSLCDNRYHPGGTIRATCNDGVVSYSNGNCTFRNYYDEPTCRGSCFTANTKVLMAKGSEVDIHKIKVGDQLMGPNGAVHTVLELDRPLLWKGKNQHLIEINGETAFTTDNHPIFTTDGWKALNPEMAEKEAYDQLAGKIGKLEVGQELVMAQGKRLLIESIMVVPHEEEGRRLYNLVLDGGHTFYANGILVHGAVPDKGGKYPISKDHDGEPDMIVEQ